MGDPQPIAFRQEPDPDPIIDATHYINHEWFVPLMAVRTTCYRCHAQSPTVLLTYGGAVTFGDPRMMRKAKTARRPDITKEAVQKFAEKGWKFQRNFSYCPQCKGLGSVP